MRNGDRCTPFPARTAAQGAATGRDGGSPRRDRPSPRGTNDAATNKPQKPNRHGVGRPNGRSTNALIAKQKLTAAFGLEMSTPLGIVASSFVFEMASWHVRLPMLAPAVARKSAQRRPLEEYESNTRSLMGKCVQQLFG